MADHEERRERLRVALTQAQTALENEPTTPESPHGLDHLRHVLSYAQLVVARTDPPLITDTAISEIEAATSQIAGNPAAAVGSSFEYATPLIHGTLRLPSAQDRDVEQFVKDAAQGLERAATERIAALTERFAEMEGRLDAGDSQAGRITEKLGEFEGALAANRTELDQMLQRHSGDFSAAQEERSTSHQTELQTARDQLADVQQRARDELSQLQEEARKELEEHVSEIRRMEQESADLVGAIGLAGTAERYSEEVEQQRDVANLMRWLTVALALGAVVAAVYAVVDGDQEPEALVAKLAVSAIFGGLATYTASQSGRHRRREERARALQLELTAFAPFIEPLAPEQREEERVIMTRKTFGRAAGSVAPEDDPGPSALSFLLRRKQKQQKEGEGS